MLSYIVKRLLLIIPTLLGILTLNFLIVQVAPGGPVEQTIARLRHSDMDATSSISGTGGSDMAGRSNALSGENATTYRGAQGLDPKLIKDIEKMYGFDKPPLTRYFMMLGNYLRFDLGNSFFRDEPVLHLILSKLPVSITLGLWTTLLTYLISIPLGIQKAVREGSWFDTWTTAIVVIGYAIPSFLFALLLIMLFSGGSYWHLFPLRGLTSDDWDNFTAWHKVTDYLWHICLPITAMVTANFARLTLLTKNSFMDEIGKQYVMTARAKGLTERAVLMKHVFRNAMLIVISGFPSAFIGILFTSSLLIEIMFSLDGLGLLGYEAIIGRDYALVFGSLYIFSLLALVTNLIGDLTYVLVDPRIDFEGRGA